MRCPTRMPPPSRSGSEYIISYFTSRWWWWRWYNRLHEWPIRWPVRIECHPGGQVAPLARGHSCRLDARGHKMHTNDRIQHTCNSIFIFTWSGLLRKYGQIAHKFDENTGRHWDIPGNSKWHQQMTSWHSLENEPIRLHDSSHVTAWPGSVGYLTC